MKYRNQMRTIAARVINDTTTLIIPILKQYESEYVNDAYAGILANAFKVLEKRYSDIDRLAQVVATSFVDDVNNSNRQRFYKAMNKVIGVNLNSIVQNEGLGDTLIASTEANVALIKTIPTEHLKKIQTAVYTGTIQGSTSKSLLQTIAEISKGTMARPKLIARDQTAKINSAFNQQRQQNFGVTEYTWRTAEDGNVRETHKENNGKVFRWDKPPKETGHPGNDIQCRCIAQAIINI